MTVDELRTLLDTLPGDFKVCLRDDYRTIPVRGHVLLDDELVLTPYETP